MAQVLPSYDKSNAVKRTLAGKIIVSLFATVYFSLENILTERSGIEESNGTKVTCFRQSFDAARIVIKP